MSNIPHDHDQAVAQVLAAVEGYVPKVQTAACLEAGMRMALAHGHERIAAQAMRDLAYALDQRLAEKEGRA